MTNPRRNVMSSKNRLDQTTTEEEENIANKTNKTKIDYGTLLRPFQPSLDRIVTELLRVVQTWDVKVSLVKKHMVMGHLVPTMVGSAASVVVQRKRRISVEIHGPADDFRLEQETRRKNNSMNYPHEEMLQDEDIVILRLYKVETTTSSSSSSNDDAEDDEEEEQIEMKSFRIEDIRVVKQRRGGICEIMVGSEMETLVYDVRFPSEKDCLAFCKLVDKLRTSEEERSRRQAESYREKQRSKEQQADNNDEYNIRLLVEIVSATSLPNTGMFTSTSDPYVTVKMGGKQIHQTKMVSSTLDPIWTLQKGCLFLLQMTPEQFFSSTGGMTFTIINYSMFGSDEVLGRARLSLDEILKVNKGNRIEYEIALEKGIVASGDKRPHFYLRIREADESDIEFMKVYEDYKGMVGVYSDETYSLPRPPDLDLLKLQKRVVKAEGPLEEDAFLANVRKCPEVRLQRVRPYPDPERFEGTAWLTKEQIEEESWKTSTTWLDSGSGDLGRLYVEILSCDGLPNMDLIRTSNVLDKTDAFVCMVYEDCVVNTDVIGDSTAPRWMPWCRRAFTFRIAHPESALYVGVFDYDAEQSPLQISLRVVKPQHNPIGRCVVNLTRFNPDTVYTLTYPVFYDAELEEHRGKPRGTITMRLRLEWFDTRKTMYAALEPPGRTLVSCPRKIHWQVARYTVEGVHDDTAYSMNRFAHYIKELQNYEKVTPYVQEAMLTVWLWRGHYPITFWGKTILYLPLHSITAFSWGLLICRDFNYVPAFLIFSIRWLFLATNEIVRRTPSTWHKPRGYAQLWSIVLFGNFFVEETKPNQNLDAIRSFDAAQERRMKQWMASKELKAKHEEELRKELGTEMQAAEAGVDDIATKAAEGVMDKLNVRPLKPTLHPIQLKLRKVVIACRIATKFFLWEEAYYSFWITTFSFVACLAVLWVPWGKLLRCELRVAIIVMLGPWMAIIDRCFFRQTKNMTDEEHEAMVKEKLEKRYDAVIRSISNYQVKKERAVKLKSMKEYCFGKFLIRIPRVREDVYSDTPLPQSYSEVRTNVKPPRITERKFGQHLKGDMIPTRDIQTSSSALAVSEKKSRTKRPQEQRFCDLRRPVSEKAPLLGRWFKRGSRHDKGAGACSFEASYDSMKNKKQD